MAISEEEKILGLVVMAERQQKELADAIAVMSASVAEFKSVSANVSQQVRVSVAHEIQGMNIGQLVGRQTAETFQAVEKTAWSIRQHAEAIDREAFSAKESLLREYKKLKNRFWWFISGGVVFAVLLALFNTWYFNDALEKLHAGHRVIYEAVSSSESESADEKVQKTESR